MNLTRLPRYSPFLHPAKNPISTWKSSFKTQLNARQHKLINIRDEITLVDYRFRLIGEMLESSKGAITVAKFRSWEQHVFTYLPTCLRKDNIQR